ncbi:MAG: RHS repeat-associated core domain-containing protein, partial [Thermoanaerobaculia bacterium]
VDVAATYNGITVTTTVTVRPPDGAMQAGPPSAIQCASAALVPCLTATATAPIATFAATDYARRYSFYTPELNLMAESEETSLPAPRIEYEYIWFAGQPLAQVNRTTGEVAWYFNDHLGAPLLQTDSSATVVWRAEHEPYGAVHTFRVGTDIYQPLRLPGQEAGDSEFAYNIFRWYRVGWGRYTQPDPVFRRFPYDGSALYMYADESPVGTADPLGLYSISTQHRRIERYARRRQLPPVCLGQLSCTDFGRDFDRDSSLTCTCVGCGNNWSPRFSAVLAYDMYLASEQPYPGDPWHEIHEVQHIDDIIGDLGQWLNSLERQEFGEDECNAICRASVGLFRTRVASFAAASQARRH